MGSEASLGAIVRAKGGELLEKFPTSSAQRKVMRAMADCRSAALGGHRDSCDSCGFEHIFWNSCRDRHCAGCGGQARQHWLDARREEVLDVPYFHVVFTIPWRQSILNATEHGSTLHDLNNPFRPRHSCIVIVAREGLACPTRITARAHHSRFCTVTS
jgi:hypothetical protein